MNLAAWLHSGSWLYLVLAFIPCNAAPGAFHSDSASKGIPDAGEDLQTVTNHESSTSDHYDSDKPSAVRNDHGIIGSGQTESVPLSFERSGSYDPSTVRRSPSPFDSRQTGSGPWRYEYGGSYMPNVVSNVPSLLALSLTGNVPWNYAYGGRYVPSVVRNTPRVLSASQTSTPWRYEYGGSYTPSAVRNVPSLFALGQTGRAPWSYEHGGNYHPSALQHDPYSYESAYSGGAPSGYGLTPSGSSHVLSPGYNREGEYVYHTKCQTHGRYIYTVKPNPGSHEPTGEASFSPSDSDHMGSASRTQDVSVKPEPGSYRTASVGDVPSNYWYGRYKAGSSRPVSSEMESFAMRSVPGSYRSSGAETFDRFEGAQTGDGPSGYPQDSYEPHVSFNHFAVKSVPRYTGYF